MANSTLKTSILNRPNFSFAQRRRGAEKTKNLRASALLRENFTLRLLHHSRLAVILLIYLLLAAAHSLIVPLTTGNDEWAHFLYLRFIAEHGRLPATITEREEAGYKSDAPPLYHLLTAVATSGVEPTRLLRPLTSDQPRRYLADNIINSYALVHTAVEQFPFRGEVLLWHLGRGVSVLFGLILVILTYLTSLLIFPGCYRRAAVAAGLMAFTPAFIFHSSVLSYESLSAVLTALFLLAALKTLARPQQWRWWLAMGLTAGLAITTKYSAVLLPLEICFVAWLTSNEQGVMNNEQKAKKIGGVSLDDTQLATPNSQLPTHNFYPGGGSRIGVAISYKLVVWLCDWSL